MRMVAAVVREAGVSAVGADGAMDLGLAATKTTPVSTAATAADSVMATNGMRPVS